MLEVEPFLLHKINFTSKLCILKTQCSEFRSAFNCFFSESRLYDSKILSRKGKLGVWLILFIELGSNLKTLDLLSPPVCLYW